MNNTTNDYKYFSIVQYKLKFNYEKVGLFVFGCPTLFDKMSKKCCFDYC